MAKDWLATDLVREHFDAAAQFVANSRMTAYRDIANTFLLRPGSKASEQHESPLEMIFSLWFIAHQCAFQPNDEIYLEPQHKVTAGWQSYRLDFVIRPYWIELPEELARHGMAWPLIAVELDGHAFHEKTKEQVADRNMRDRNLQQANWKVFHFSFSEFTSDPAARVLDVIHYATTEHRKVVNALRAQNPELVFQILGY